MNNNLKKQLKLYQIIIILYFICHGSLCGIGSKTIFSLAYEDAWIIPIVIAIIGLIPFSITLYIVEKYPNKNIFEIIEYQFGKIIGKIINSILILFVCSYVIIFYWNFTNFISSQYLYNTPQTFITILFIIPIVYLLSKGIKIVLRSSIVIFIMTFTFYIIAATGLIPQIHVENIYPILAEGIGQPLKAVFTGVGYLVLPTLLITCISKDSYVDTNNFKKRLIIAYFIVFLTIEIMIFTTLAIFGVELVMLYQYPEFQILRRVTIGGFIERVESTLSIHWILDLFMMIVFGCYFIKTGLIKVFNIKKQKIDKFILNPIIVFLILTSLKIFSNNIIASEFLIEKYPIFCYIFFLGISILIFITSKIKKKHST